MLLLTCTLGNLTRILCSCFMMRSKSINLKLMVVTAPAAWIPQFLSNASMDPVPYRLSVSPSSSARWSSREPAAPVAGCVTAEADVVVLGEERWWWCWCWWWWCCVWGWVDDELSCTGGVAGVSDTRDEDTERLSDWPLVGRLKRLLHVTKYKEEQNLIKYRIEKKYLEHDY